MQKTPQDDSLASGTPETWSLYSRKLKSIASTIQKVMALRDAKVPAALRTAIHHTLGRLNACAPKGASLALPTDRVAMSNERSDLNFALTHLDKLEQHLQSLRLLFCPSTHAMDESVVDTLEQEIESLRAICRVRARQIANGSSPLLADVTLH